MDKKTVEFHLRQKAAENRLGWALAVSLPLLNILGQIYGPEGYGPLGLTMQGLLPYLMGVVCFYIFGESSTAYFWLNPLATLIFTVIYIGSPYARLRTKRDADIIASFDNHDYLASRLQLGSPSVEPAKPSRPVAHLWDYVICVPCGAYTLLYALLPILAGVKEKGIIWPYYIWPTEWYIWPTLLVGILGLMATVVHVRWRVPVIEEAREAREQKKGWWKEGYEKYKLRKEQGLLTSEETMAAEDEGFERHFVRESEEAARQVRLAEEARMRRPASSPSRRGSVLFGRQRRREIPLKVRHEVFRRAKNRCQQCGKSAADGVQLEVDHIIPVSRGGSDNISNLQLLCFDCNRGKSDKVD